MRRGEEQEGRRGGGEGAGDTGQNEREIRRTRPSLGSSPNLTRERSLAQSLASGRRLQDSSACRCGLVGWRRVGRGVEAAAKVDMMALQRVSRVSSMTGFAAGCFVLRGKSVSSLESPGAESRRKEGRSGRTRVLQSHQ